MSTQQSITDAFLVVSCISLWIQASGWRQLRGSSETLGRALRRTAISRVACSILYVYVGLNAFWVHFQVVSTTFSVFCIVQVTWWINGRADVRLRRKVIERSRSCGRVAMDSHSPVLLSL